MAKHVIPLICIYTYIVNGENARERYAFILLIYY